MTATSFTAFMENMARAFELAWALVLVLGFAWSVVLAVRVLARSGTGRAAYQILLLAFGGTLMLGPEVLVAADLVRTVAIEPTMENIGALGLIVLIRTVLSFSLEIEIEGVLPWRKALVSGGRHIIDATIDSGGASRAPRRNLSGASEADRHDDNDLH